MHPNSTNPDPKFSSHFQSVFIDFQDSDLPPVEWHNSPDPESQTDGFEIKREGSEDLKIKILFQMHHLPELYELTHPALIEMNKNNRISTLPRLAGMIYSYISTARHPIDENKKVILDDKLKNVRKRFSDAHDFKLV